MSSMIWLSIFSGSSALLIRSLILDLRTMVSRSKIPTAHSPSLSNFPAWPAGGTGYIVGHHSIFRCQVPGVRCQGLRLQQGANLKPEALTSDTYHLTPTRHIAWFS